MQFFKPIFSPRNEETCTLTSGPAGDRETASNMEKRNCIKPTVQQLTNVLVVSMVLHVPGLYGRHGQVYIRPRIRSVAHKPVTAETEAMIPFISSFGFTCDRISHNFVTEFTTPRFELVFCTFFKEFYTRGR